MGEHMEGVGNLGEVVDESSVEVHKPYEGLDILYLCWLWPVHDSLDLNRVHCYMVFGDDKPREFTLLILNFTFFCSEENFQRPKVLQYFLGDSPLSCEGCRAVENVSL